MSKRKRSGACAYCGTGGPVTTDHVPPRGLFAKANRSDLIRVDSCAHCNAGFAKDDEYFRMMLSMRDDVDGVPDAQEAMAATLRALSRPDQKKLQSATLRNITPAEKWHGGLYLGRRPAYRVDLVRLQRTVERVIKGLFWHEVGHRLPDDHVVHCIPLDALPAGDLNALIGVGRVSGMAASGGLRRVAGGAFEYAMRQTADQPDATIWVLRFYGRVNFVGLTLRVTDLDRMTVRSALRAGMPSAILGR